MSLTSAQNSFIPREKIVEELIQGRELAKELKIVLDKPLGESEYSMANDLLVKILDSFIGPISIINQSPKEERVSSPVAALTSSEFDSRREDSSDSSKTSVFKDRSGCNRRGCYKRRKNAHTSTIVAPNLTDDGHAWRKYGQKVILNAKHPRNYFRCTHKFDQGCPATKQVQKTEDEPPLYQTTYHGSHTCKKPLLKTPQIIFDSTHFDGSEFLLSFGSNNRSFKPNFPQFPFTILDHDQSPPSDLFSSDLTAIGSSTHPMSAFSPVSSVANAHTHGMDRMDMLEGIYDVCEPFEFGF